MLTGCQRLKIEVRFLRHTKRLPSGCLIWTGAQSSGGPGVAGRKSRGGPYGSFKVSKEVGTKRAHVVYAFLLGLIPDFRVPDGCHLDHTCESGTLCVSCLALVPDHINLELRHTRPKHEAAAAVTAEVQQERRARRARERRRAAAARRRAATGNPKRKKA